MDIIDKYFKIRPNVNAPTSDVDIDDLERRLGTHLPNDFKAFLKQINGFEGNIGESYVRLNRAEEIEAYTRDYCSEFFPDKICIGTNGGGELFVIDKGSGNQKYGVMPAIGDKNDYIELGDTLEKFIRRVSEGTYLK